MHTMYDDPNGENAPTQDTQTDEGAALANGPEAE